MPAEKARIGIVLASVPGYSETFFASKIKGLITRGHRITLFARGAKSPYAGVKLVTPWPVPQSQILRVLLFSVVIPFTFLRAPLQFLRLWRLEQEEGVPLPPRCRLIYLNAHILPYELDWLSFGFATQAIDHECVAKAIGAKMSVSLRGSDIFVYPLKHPGCYRKVWKYVDQIHSLSKALLNEAQRQGLPSDARAVIIPPAIDITKFPARQKAGWSSPLQFVTVARLHWIKGIEYAIGAMKMLKHAGFDFTYHIVGDGEAREQLLLEIKEAGLRDIVFLDGKRTSAQVSHMLRQCDLYLQPSLNEGFCNAVLEAQACGSLCIVSNVGGLPENIVDKVTGWLVPPRDAIALASAIEKVVCLSEQECEAVRSRARGMVVSDFGIDLQLDRWEQYYNKNVI